MVAFVKRIYRLRFMQVVSVSVILISLTLAFLLLYHMLLNLLMIFSEQCMLPEFEKGLGFPNKSILTAKGDACYPCTSIE